MRPVPGTEIEAFRREPAQYQAMKTLLDGVNTTRAALAKGDYAGAPQYGRWGSVFVSPQAMRDGVSAPTWGTFASTFIMPTFVPVNSLHGMVEVPESYRAGGIFLPTVHFSFNFAAPAAGNTFQWGLQAMSGGPFAVLRTGTTALATYTASGNDDRRLCSVKIPLAPMALEAGSLVIFEVMLSAKVSAVSPVLLGVSWAYQKQDFGRSARP